MQYTVFEGTEILFRGDLETVLRKVKKKIGSKEHCPFLILNDQTGKSMDFNFRGREEEVLERIQVYKQESTPSATSAGPGRPKIGVVSREVSLLPRHWEWLAAQSGGASSTLRKLVEEAMNQSAKQKDPKAIQERAYKVMSTLGGDLPGYEEALRRLYRRDRNGYFELIQSWPKDLRQYLTEMTEGAF